MIFGGNDVARNKAKKKKVEVSTAESLTQNPFEHLGRRFGVKPEPDRGGDSQPESAVPDVMEQPMLLVRLEKRKNGKRVTRVYHLCDGQKAMLKKMKRKLATGGSELEDALELQGDHRQAVVALLEGEGYKVRLGN